MATAVKYFNRYELKYVLQWEEFETITTDLASFLEADQHGDQHEGYLVTSLYYDTADYKAYWDKIEGHRFRRKLRIRVYGDDPVTPETTCFVEIKQRVNKTMQKKRMMMPYHAARSLCDDGHLTVEMPPEDEPLVQEITYLSNTLDLRPTCVVSYTRLAFNGTEYDPGLRITFDTNLKGRVQDLDLQSLTYTKNRYFVPPQWCVMEIKVNNRVPYWVTQFIGKYGCVLRRVGKYCTALEESKIPLYRQRIGER